MSGHTPGPWRVGAEDADSGEIEVVSDDRPYVCMVLPGAIDGRTRANARLIAAAPALLEALQEMIELRDAGLRSEVHPTRNELDIVRDARAAIRQATEGEDA